MTLTKISTGGVKDDAISAGKIPANAVGSSEIADDAVGAAQIADDGVAQSAVADEAIDEARLQISNAGSNGQFLQKQSGNTGGLTWATVTVPDADKVIEGNTSVEAVDTGSDGHVKITTEGVERLKVQADGDVCIGNNATSMNNAADNLIVGSGSGHNGITIYSGADSDGWTIFNDGDNSNLTGALKYNHVDNYLAFYANAGEKYRIGSSGQLGVGGATYGTSGQVLTSGGASAAPSWADVPAGGNSIDLVADGAIAAGKPVVIKTNGKAAQITEALTGVSLDSGFSWNGTATNATSNGVGNLVGGAYDATADKWLTWWVNQDDNNTPRLTIWRFVGSSDTCTQDTFGMNASTGATGLANSTDYEGDVLYDPSGGKVIGVYRHQDGQGKCWIGTTTTGASNTMTIGYCRTFETGDTKNFSLVYNPDAQKSLVTFCDEDDSGKGKSVVITTSGSGSTADVSFGDTDEFNSANTNASSVVYDTHNDKFVVFYIGQSNYPYAKIGTISGTDVTWGSQVEVNAGACAQIKGVYTKNGVMYVQYGRQSKLRGRVITSDGSSLTIGSEIDVENYFDEFHKLRYDSFNDMVYSVHDVGSGNANTQLQKITISGTTPTLRGTTNRYYGNINQRALGEYNNGRTPLFYDAYDSGNYLHGLCYRSANLASNVTTSSNNSILNYTNILGFAEDAISDGATGTIKLPGNVVANQSGLTAGTYYYHNGNGSLTTSGDTTIVNAKAGIAISSTKLVIADPNQQSQ